jgi:two-component system response regulator PilR (NtrC family)
MPKPKILIVDDEPSLLGSMKIGLELMGYSVSMAAGGEEAVQSCTDLSFDAVLLDMKMPGMGGLEVLGRLREIAPRAVVLMLTAHGNIEDAVEAVRAGAYDFLLKPSSPDAIDLRVRKAIEHRDLSAENLLLRSQLREKYRFNEIVGNSTAMQEVYDLMERVCGTENAVLVTGETGTGKELVARAIHYNGPRAERRFYGLHCGAIPEGLLESEMFGHEKGAFTGAIAQKIGVFEAAREGTLFLDEIGEMSPVAQVRLLRVLQEREFFRVGSTTPIKADVRLITATNRNLRKEVQEGRFRQDLYYRLNVIEIQLPPLRKRRDDIPLLVRHFLQKYGLASSRTFRVSEEALQILVAHDWPGNIRELENSLRRAVTLCQDSVITPKDLPSSVCETSLGAAPAAFPLLHLPLRVAKEAFEQEYIERLLEQTGGNISMAARMAGIAWQNFHQKLKKYGIDAKKFSAG